jgi:GTP-binding protein
MKASALFAGPCDFTAGAARLDQMPGATLPEVAFAGRSNVGKSSLINALTGRKTLARTSRTPGRTQQLNFFNIGGRFFLVDMPGYGYAQVSRDTKMAWDKLITDYLRGRSSLRCVYILIDSRHGLKDSDHELMDMLDEAAVPCRIVFTKADKTGGDEYRELAHKTVDAIKRHRTVSPDPLFTSAEKKQGIEELREAVMAVAV